MWGLGLQYFADLVQILPTIRPSVQNFRLFCFSFWDFSIFWLLTMKISNVIFRQAQNDHRKFQRHFLHRNPKWPWKTRTSFSPLKPKMTMENSNVIFRQTQNDQWKFQRHFLHWNPKRTWKIPTSFSPLKPKMTMENSNVIFSPETRIYRGFPTFWHTIEIFGTKYYFIFIIAKPKTNWQDFRYQGFLFSVKEMEHGNFSVPFHSVVHPEGKS